MNYSKNTLYCVAFLFLSLFSFDTKSEPLSAATAVCVGHVTITNPVVALVGSAVALSTVAHNAYQAYLQKQALCPSTPSEIPIDVTLAERAYYEQRCNALRRIRNELVTIKSDIEALQGLRWLGSASFTHQFLKKYAYTKDTQQYEQLTGTQEKRYSERQKESLRCAREKELKLLERQINTIQLLLALHVHQLIEAVKRSRDTYESVIEESNETVHAWNKDLEYVPKEIALQLYKYHIVHEYLLRKMCCAVEEFKLIESYYRVCNSRCIRNTTTILKALEDASSAIVSADECIKSEKKRLQENIVIAEGYFAQNKISLKNLKNEIINNLEQQQKENDAQIIKKLEKDLSHYNRGGGPKKDDDEEKCEEQRIKISEKDKDHIFREADGHFPKDTPECREIIEDLVADKNNFDGVDSYGTTWYSKITASGKQIWAGVRNNTIRYAGINQKPWPKDNITGLLIRQR